MQFLTKLALLALTMCVVGCGPVFDSATPRGFVKLNDPGPYDYRATSPDGLVIAAREMKHEPKGESSFWERAVSNEMRQRGGYALLDTRDVHDATGLEGRQLRFGHDEGKEPHVYVVTLFLTKKRIVVVEVGGTKELIERHEADIAWAIDQFYADGV